MKKTFFIVTFFLTAGLQAQTVHDYLEKIRNNSAALTAFFSQMPKGGDLHHHYSGSVYAETFFDIAVEKNFFINRTTLEIRESKPVQDISWTDLSSLQKEGLLAEYKLRLLQQWSAKDYDFVSYPSYRQFFESFGHFNIAADMSFDRGLLELKQRAKTEHVAYIETMLKTIDCDKAVTDLYPLNEKLEQYQSLKNNFATDVLLDSLFTIIEKRNVAGCAIKFNDELKKLHESLAIDDSVFTMRYQNFVLRFMNPVQLFTNLVIAFESANRSPLVVGVNIVAPEHEDVSMNDYWLHIQMFKYCHKKFPAVKYSMHAGELALGMVKPEELSWHINAAVYDAKANRIGHGVDLPYEKDCYSLLNYMSKNDIAVEINLYSNEFILKIKEDKHPIMLYKTFGVPIVISSDDAGVLRSNLTDQYVLLAYRYRNISYEEIKRFVYNSIQYSFIEEPAIKQKLRLQLDKDFRLFENKIMAIKDGH
ncbi:MAG: hypothetical protein ABI741_02895 [Ferruginibacter sp.]